MSTSLTGGIAVDFIDWARFTDVAEEGSGGIGHEPFTARPGEGKQPLALLVQIFQRWPQPEANA